MLFTDFLGKWLNDKVTEIPAEEYSSFAYYVKSNISPYFSAHNAKVTEITDQELIAYFETERLQNGTGNKALLSINRTICTALDYAVTIGWRADNPAHDINPCLMSTTPYFTDFLRDWLQELETFIQEKNDTKEILTNFISKLEDLTGEQTEFREELWGGLVDHIRIDEKSSTVVFRGGIEITI